MKKIILLLTALIFAHVTGFSQNSDAVYRKLIKEYTLNEDGSSTLRVYKELSILSFLALNRLYGETFILTNPKFQKLKINSSYTIMTDGTKITTPENAFNEVLPGFASDAPYFNGLREMVVTHTGLELGATIYLDYTIESNKAFYPFLMGHEIIAESSPVEDYEVVIKLPQGKKLNFKILNLTQQPDKLTENGKDVFKWVFKSVPALGNEPFREKDLNSVPQLSFSSTSHDELMKWMVASDAFTTGLPVELENKMDELVKGESDELKIILKVSNWLNSGIETVSIPSALYGYNPRTASDVYNSGIGTRLEKSVLFANLLKYLKMNAQPVFLANSMYFDKNIGNVHIFNDIMIQVNTKNYATLYLLPDGKNKVNQKYLIAGKTVIPMTANSSDGIVNIVQSENDIEVDCELVWNSEKNTLDGDLEFELKGAVNPYFDLSQDTMAFRNMIAGGLAGKDIISVKPGTSNELQSEGAARIYKEKALREQDGFWFLDIPLLKNGLESFQMSAINVLRSSPLEMPFVIEESYEIELTVPEGFKMINKPVDIKEETELGKIVIGFKQDSNKIKIIRTIEINTKVVYGADYPKFKNMINNWNVQKHRQLILKAE